MTRTLSPAAPTIPAAPAAPAAPGVAPAVLWPRPALVLGAAALAAALGFAVTRDPAAAAAFGAADPPLLRLLRGMALLKGALAAGATALVVWRLRIGAGAGAGLAALYAGAVALMAASPGVIWNLGHVLAGAALFHAGLLLLLGVAWADRDGPVGRLSRLGTAASGRPARR